ncbi:BTAD domain-containing putative transcriptional regulator [Actinoplanes sp. NPDC049265]|uniref:AfsR/SARP family transcriptional regulator n=1 Tax=Actinoplanes sp. NPDC049265 TaxID=3363902 RepID=UPI003724318B
MDSSVDAERFRAALAVATALTDPEERAAQLDRVLTLWQGRTGIDPAEWLHAVAARWSTEIDRERPGAAIGPLTTLVADHPRREDLLILLIRALHRAGRPGDALEVYRRARTRLVEEFGIEPGPDLHRLQEAVLRGDPDPLPVADPAARPAGGFVGREAALAELDTLRGGTIGVIGGPAGVGKTAVAVRWAALARHRFPDGHLVLDLRGAGPGRPLSTTEALSRMLRALGVAPARIPVEVGEAAATYRARMAGCRLVLILDNAAGAEQVRPLLPGSPRSVVVVTGRDRLSGLVAIEGAHRIVLPPLTHREACDVIDGAADDLIRACGRLPLALRIAAGPARRRPVAGIRTDGGTGGGTEAGPVAWAFGFAYDHLDRTAAATLRMLALAPDGVVTLPMAAALTGRPPADVIACLGELTDAHLLEQDGDQWRIHDLVAAQARDRLAAETPEPERTEAAARLLDWHLDTSDSDQRRIGPAIYRAALRAAERRGETRRLGVLLNHLAVALTDAGEPAEAREHLDRALALHRRHGDLAGEAETARLRGLLGA